MPRENIIRPQLLNDFSQFAKRMRLKYIFHGQDKQPHPFHVKSDWDLPVRPSVALETFLEEVKFELANIKFNRPKDNLVLGTCDKVLKYDKLRQNVAKNPKSRYHIERYETYLAKIQLLTLKAYKQVFNDIQTER